MKYTKRGCANAAPFAVGGEFMAERFYTDIIADQTRKAMWEVGNVIDCIPDALWDSQYCYMPLWKHVYHTLHSLDKWFINPNDADYQEPSIHEQGLNDLDAVSAGRLGRNDIEHYFAAIKQQAHG